MQGFRYCFIVFICLVCIHVEFSHIKGMEKGIFSETPFWSFFLYKWTGGYLRLLCYLHFIPFSSGIMRNDLLIIVNLEKKNTVIISIEHLDILRNVKRQN